MPRRIRLSGYTDTLIHKEIGYEELKFPDFDVLEVVGVKITKGFDPFDPVYLISLSTYRQSENRPTKAAKWVKSIFLNGSSPFF